MRAPSGQEPANRPERGEFVFAARAAVSEQVFNRFYREVLKPAFPPEELNDLETRQTAHLALPGFDGKIALTDGEPIGGAPGEYYAASGVVMLGYLAVWADVRGHGLGSTLLDDLKSKWRRLFRALRSQVHAWSEKIPLWPLSWANEVPRSHFGGASSHV